MNNKIKEANKSMNSFYENITYEEYMEMIQEQGSNYITKTIMTPQEKYALFFSEMEEMGFEFFDYQEDVENLIKKITE